MVFRSVAFRNTQDENVLAIKVGKVEVIKIVNRSFREYVFTIVNDGIEKEVASGGYGTTIESLAES